MTTRIPAYSLCLKACYYAVTTSSFKTRAVLASSPSYLDADLGCASLAMTKNVRGIKYRRVAHGVTLDTSHKRDGLAHGIHSVGLHKKKKPITLFFGKSQPLCSYTLQTRWQKYSRILLKQYSKYVCFIHISMHETRVGKQLLCEQCGSYRPSYKEETRPSDTVSVDCLFCVTY